MSVTASKLTAFPALLVHLATSIWMLGNRAIFSSAINEKGNALVSKAYQPIDDLDLMSAIAIVNGLGEALVALDGATRVANAKRVEADVLKGGLDGDVAG